MPAGRLSPGQVRPPAWPWWALVLLPLAAVAAALVSQHVYGMEPCSWCVFQRLVFVVIALAALPGLVVRHALVRRVVAAEVLLISVIGTASALWMHFVAAQAESCNLTLADRIVGGLGLDGLLPEVFAAYASCADASVRLFGLRYELYALAMFVLLGVLALGAMRRPV